MTESHYNPGLHRVAWLLALATFPLIFLGGLVTSHQAGMSVPDWPNSYGYNMFLFPPSQWVGGIFYEHTHRLLGTVVGFLSVVLVAWAWGPSRNPGVRNLTMKLAAIAALAAALASLGFGFSREHSLRSHESEGVLGLALIALVLGIVWRARNPEPRRAVRWLATAALGAVILQGVLGGLRVVLVKLDLAVVHACFAQAFFCLTALLVLVTSQWWAQAPDRSATPQAVRGRRVIGLAALAVVTVFGQLVVGAVMRHYDAGLAIADFPLAFGRLLPPTKQQHLPDPPPINLPNMPASFIQILRTQDISPAVFICPSTTSEPAFGSVYPPSPPSPILYPRQWWMPPQPPTAYEKWMSHWEQPEYVAKDLTIAKVWLHFGHRMGALISSIVLLGLVMAILRLKTRERGLVIPALLLVVLLWTQVSLGALTVLLRKPADVASAHVAVGALVLMTTFVLAAKSFRLYAFRRQSVVRGGFEPVMPNERSPSPLYSGERAGVRGRSRRKVDLRTGPHPNPLP